MAFTKVTEADTALALPIPDPDTEIKLRTCLARSLALTGNADRAQAEVARIACRPFFPAGQGGGGDWQDAVALADRALYAAKHSGRDAWVGMWGQDDSAATISDVIDDPEAHAASGAVIVASSRELVLWHPHAGPD